MSVTASVLNPTATSVLGSAQASQGIGFTALGTAMISSLVIFGVQLFAFILLRDNVSRIFIPKTYLATSHERVRPPPRHPLGWLLAAYSFKDPEIIKKCGLDAYFFLRYLRTLLKIFFPFLVIVATLVPLNSYGGRGSRYALESNNETSSSVANVTGMDQYAWGNIRPTHTSRYWAHLTFAVLAIIWVCRVFFEEMRLFVRERQRYLQSYEYNLRTSATSVLVSAIPPEQRNAEELKKLFGDITGGVRNIWMNREIDDLVRKIRERDAIHAKLEAAETELIRKAEMAKATKGRDCIGRVKDMLSQCYTANNANEDVAVTEKWQVYLRKGDRPTHRLAVFNWAPGWLPRLPLFGRKVDTIYWCREELSRLNIEIEEAQERPDQFSPMNSAFIQFNDQLSAHRACQSIHRKVRHMTPRTVGISPRDVIWDNMSISWWESWLRLGGVTVVITGFVILWAIPVIWTAYLSQMTFLIRKYSWLYWLDKIPQKVLEGLSGVLPALVLSIVLAVVPPVLDNLAELSGARSGTQKQKYIQKFYFAFLFLQVFLIVSISRGAFTALATTMDIATIPNTLATQLPKAANYFFSYMILQALSVSSGTLLQPLTVLYWFLMPKCKGLTARERWKRDTTLSTITWSTYFPVYTNFACIALIYSIVSPLIIVFAIITFTFLWITNRYNMLYVVHFRVDTGGLLYPTAINQTFTGLYVMELCLIGLFFLVEDEVGKLACVPQAIIMIVMLFCTAFYQILLNMAFSPLTIATKQKATSHDDDVPDAYRDEKGAGDGDDSSVKSRCPETQVLDSYYTASSTNANDQQETISSELNDPDGEFRLPRGLWSQDCKDQEKITEALYGYSGRMCDLGPKERDLLAETAFQHYALKVKRPILWIPKDEIGVSDDEVKQTEAYDGGSISITNKDAALDDKLRVVYKRNPPDFSALDLVPL